MQLMVIRFAEQLDRLDGWWDPLQIAAQIESKEFLCDRFAGMACIDWSDVKHDYRHAYAYLGASY
jgi:hypothetical protein